MAISADDIKKGIGDQVKKDVEGKADTAIQDMIKKLSDKGVEADKILSEIKSKFDIDEAKAKEMIEKIVKKQ